MSQTLRRRRLIAIRPEPFMGKRVVIVGLANTACDIAVDLCGTAKQVFCSHRTGSRVVSGHHYGVNKQLNRNPV